MKPFIALLLLVVSSAVHALAPVSGFSTYNAGFPSNVFKGATKLAACGALGGFMAGKPSPNGGPYTGKVSGMIDSSGTYCYLETTRTDGSIIYSGQTAYQVVNVCSDGTNPDTSKPLASQCADPAPTCATGTAKESAIYQGMKDPVTGGIVGGNYAFPTTVDGCMIRVTSLKGCVSQADGKVFCTFRYTVNQPAPTGTNGVVSAGPPSGALKEEIATGVDAAKGEGCPQGTVSTGVSASGMVQCAGTGTNTGQSSTPVTTKPTTTTTNADGSTTAKTDVVTTNKDGSTTTTTTTVTTLSDGTKTTSVGAVTGAATDGTSGKPDQKVGEDPYKGGDLCKLHPELNLCKNSTFSGTCGEIACTGDAIQCGILREQAAAACRDKTDRDAVTGSAHKTLGDALLAGNDPLGTTLPTKGKATEWTMPSSLDNQGWLGGGSCFPDKQFSVRGYSFTLSFTKACDPLITLRYALMIIALLVSFRMLSGSILKD